MLINNDSDYLEVTTDCRPDSELVARHFNHSATTYHLGARLQKEVAEELHLMLEKNADVSLSNEWLVDLGAGPGLFSNKLFSTAQNVLSLDLCSQMLKQHTDRSIRI
jgi:predicted TPR repeat methyltransferase